MKCISLFVAIGVVFAPLFSVDFLNEHELNKLVQERDYSVRSVQGEKYYLNADCIYANNGGLYLETENFGARKLQTISQDSGGVYLVGDIMQSIKFYKCEKTDCRRIYYKPIKVCPNIINDGPRKGQRCNGKDFLISERYPG